MKFQAVPHYPQRPGPYWERQCQCLVPGIVIVSQMDSSMTSRITSCTVRSRASKTAVHMARRRGGRIISHMVGLGVSRMAAYIAVFRVGRMTAHIALFRVGRIAVWIVKDPDGNMVIHISRKVIHSRIGLGKIRFRMMDCLYGVSLPWGQKQEPDARRTRIINGTRMGIHNQKTIWENMMLHSLKWECSRMWIGLRCLMDRHGHGLGQESG